MSVSEGFGLGVILRTQFISLEVYSESHEIIRMVFILLLLMYLALMVDWQRPVAEMMNVICHWRTKFHTFAFGFSRVAPGSYFESLGKGSGCA